MGRGGPGGPMMGGGNGQGRWNLSIYHTLRFSETARISPTGPVLDLLDGDALTGGGVPRNAIEFEGGAFHKGFGLRLNGSWAEATKLKGTGAPGSSDLRFGELLNLDARIFVNFDQQKSAVRAVPFLKGSRLALEIDNVLDTHQKVTDENGEVPLSYQAAYMDPRGRVIGLDFRKTF
jgi:iron complex outermembrane receptor protein